MVDVTEKELDELESHEENGWFLFGDEGLGVTSFGMNVERFSAGSVE